MTFEKVTVIGLGLIGGSLASALRRRGAAEEVFGVEKNPASLRYAMENGIVDDGSLQVDRGASGSDVVVIATYSETVLQAAKDVSSFVSDGTAICDTASVKAPVVRDMEENGPTNISFVGAHPIAGTEKSGVRAADPDLFSGKKCVLTPIESTFPEDVSKVRDLFESVGSTVVEIDPEVHDRIFSLVSHMPHAVAYSLVNSVASVQKETGVDLFGFSGRSFADFTRVCGSSADMWTSVLIQNRERVIRALECFSSELAELEKAVASGDEESLREILDRGRQAKFAAAGKGRSDV